MKNILALSDFSEIAENAVQAAFAFAKQYNAELNLYHYLENEDLVVMDLASANHMASFRLETDIAQKSLDHWKTMAHEMGVKARIIIGAEGNEFAEELSKIVGQTSPDILIMGSTGIGQNKETVWGSTTQLVVKEFDRPVLVIKAPMPDYHLDHIVFASSFDKKDQEVFRHFLDLVQPPPEALIHLLAINTAAYFSQPTHLMREVMQDYVKLAAPWKAKAHFYEDVSKEAGIKHFVEEVKPDLLVMSNKFDKPLKYALSGNLALRMSQVADLPVLTIDY